MPREVWDPDEPSKAFTPKKLPLSYKTSQKRSDFQAYKQSPGLISKTQGVIGGGRQPHADPTWGKPPSGITYTEPQVTKDLNAAIQANRNRDRDRDDDGGGTTTPPKTGGETRTCESIGKTGTWGNCKDITTEDGGCTPPCTGTQTCVNGKCEEKTVVDDGSCPGCDTTKNDCINGKCTPKRTTTQEDGEGTPTMETILKPDQTPMLQELTSDMDLRNMLGSVLNKNNPLFKQARTRALQAMAARGVVNSSMAEEAVMSAVMNVAMPIATRVIDDLQRVMAANVNASNAFKEALNQAYYQELLKRVDAANTWNLNKMTEAGANWRAMLEAKTGAAGISDKGVFEEYMNMLKTQPGYGDSAPIWNATS